MSIKVHEYVFPSTGIKVLYRTVSPLVAIDVRATMEKEKPEPPMEEVELAGMLTKQPNEDDPEYVELLDLWEQEVNLKINETYAKRAKLKFDYEDWEEEVKEYRQLIGGNNLKDTDEWIFLTRIASAGNELQDFFAALSASGTPTNQAVQAAKDSFRPELAR